MLAVIVSISPFFMITSFMITSQIREVNDYLSKKRKRQFTPPASLSSAPAVVNSFVTIVCMDSATPYILYTQKTWVSCTMEDIKYATHIRVLYYGESNGENTKCSMVR